MRIALCLGGHLRRFEDLLDGFEEHVLGPLVNLEDAAVDLYLATWSVRGGTPQNDGAGLQESAWGLVPLLYDRLGVTTLRIETPRQFDGSRWEGRHGCHFDPANAVSMLYMIEQSYRLVPDPASYDLIFRVRPDLRYHSSLNLDHVRAVGPLWGPSYANWGGVNDQLAWGPPEIMRRYMCIHSDLDRIHRETEVKLHPESLVRDAVAGWERRHTDLKYVLTRADGSSVCQWNS